MVARSRKEIGRFGQRFMRSPEGEGGGGGGSPAPQPDADGVVKKGGVLEVPENAFARIKERAEAKGREVARAELEQKAKAAGFLTLDEAFSAMPKLRADAEKVGVLDPKVKELEVRTADLDKAVASTRAEKDALAVEKAKLEADISTVKAEAAKSAADLADTRFRAATREAALIAGFVDPGYAEHLVKEHVASLKPEEAAKFDRTAFFTEMKKSRPVLFAAVQPATTGNGGQGAPPPPPPPGQAARDDAKPKSVLDLSAEEYAARRRTAGIRMPVM